MSTLGITNFSDGYFVSFIVNKIILIWASYQMDTSSQCEIIGHTCIESKLSTFSEHSTGIFNLFKS